MNLPMDAAWVVAGVAFVAAGLLDPFFSVLHYDGFGFLSARMYSAMWWVARLVTRPLPTRARAFGLSLAAPLMIPATLVLWIGLEVVGFALLYLPGIRDGEFALAGSLGAGFTEALYLSGVSISTLGFGDVTARSAVFQLLTVSESLIGFAILTLTISYVLNVYQVLHRFHTLCASLHHHAAESTDALAIASPYLARGGDHLGLHLRDLHERLVSYYEDLRRYPIVFFFVSRRPYRSIPFAFRMVGDLAAAVRWGLPASHPATGDPWLSTLVTGYVSITEHIRQRFVAVPVEPPEPIEHERFVAIAKGEGEGDAWAERFLAIDAAMRLVADGPPLDPDDAYERYRGWLPFALRVERFADGVETYLGYDPRRVSEAPGGRMF